jgi:hypothetical protein
MIQLSETDIRYRINVLVQKARDGNMPEDWLKLVASIYISTSAIFGDITQDQSNILLKEFLELTDNRGLK